MKLCASRNIHLVNVDSSMAKILPEYASSITLAKIYTSQFAKLKTNILLIEKVGNKPQKFSICAKDLISDFYNNML